MEVLVSKKKGRVSHYNKFNGVFFKVLVSKIITEEFFNVFHALTTKRKKQLELCLGFQVSLSPEIPSVFLLRNLCVNAGVKHGSWWGLA